MKNFIFTLVFVIQITGFINAQTNNNFDDDDKDSKKKLSDKVFFGGSFGLQFGAFTSVTVNPIVGYKITPKLEMGMGVSYSYFKNSDYNFESSYFGANAFARYFPFASLFVQAEVEALNVDELTSFYYTDNRIWQPGALVGIGYRQNIGQRFGAQFSILYNLMQTESTPYTNPVFRIDFVF